jgi:hypothetical protein
MPQITMKNLIFVLIILAALISPLNVRAQQDVSTGTPLPEVTATPAFTLIPLLTQESTATPEITDSPTLTASPTITGELTLTATPLATDCSTLTAIPTVTIDPTATATATAVDCPTQTATATASETATPGVTEYPSSTTEPTLILTEPWQASETPAPQATETPDPVLATLCPDAQGGEPVCALSVQSSTSLFSNISLEPGLNPANANAALIDSSGQVIANTPLNPDGTFSLTAPTGNYILLISAPGHLSAQKPVTLFAGQPVNIAASNLPVGDINADNSIDALDLISLGAAYETTSPQPFTVDLNGDGFVDLFDLTLLARNWRNTGPITW